jgi:ubiquinone/menaquinone biosynthesis C-methylase UbiE
MQKTLAKPRRILEIGYGGRPLHIQIETFREIIPDKVEYHGIDLVSINSRGGELSTLFGDEHKRAMKYMKENPKPKIKLYDADARNLDPDKFESKSFDEVHMHWVHTDPRVKKEDIRRILMQIERVLSQKGVVIITGETETKQHNGIVNRVMQLLSRAPSRQVEVSMSKLGFEMKKINSREAQNEDLRREVEIDIEKTIFGRLIFELSIKSYTADTIEFMIFRRKEN